MHDGECELKKRLNFSKQYKIFTAFWDFYIFVDAVKDKKKRKKKIKIKTTKAKKKKIKVKDCRQAGIRTTIACVESKGHIH